MNNKISKNDIEKISSRYAARFKEHGDNIGLTLKPGTLEHYKKQHSIHAANMPHKKISVLDVGCALGTFREYLSEKLIDIESYTGIDIVSDFIFTCERKFPNENFFHGTMNDFFEINKKNYGAIVFCQVFNNRYTDIDNTLVVKDQLARAFERVDEVVTCDLIGNYVNYKDDFLHYYSPEEMFAYAKSITPFVKIDNSYSKFHFTLSMYKNAG